MARNEHEDDWMDEVQHREGFVTDENFPNLRIMEDEVTYRRAPAHFGVETMSARFGTLTNDLLFESTPPEKIAFSAANTADSLHDLDDDHSPFVNVLPSKQNFVVEVVKTNAVEDADDDVAQFGDVPEWTGVGYLQVNPMFESLETAPIVFEKVKAALKANDVEVKCRTNWTMDGYTLYTAEELFFNVQLLKLPNSSTIRVDFNLQSGNELHFCVLTDRIRKHCRSIDKEMLALPELSFDIFAEWDSPGELFPSSNSVNTDELALLVEEMNSECPPFVRYETAKRLKDVCQERKNRSAFFELFKDQLITALQSMLKDENEDIVRFAVCAILTFAEDFTALKGFELPQLPETLQEILTISQKRSTRKLAGDLYKTINAVC